mmetsp:Transcript_19907/g.36005  ORF Transcript_19907/g.36005 Transcript_19907/m.36005 type:complete len:85 (-) Transcript_19907:1090-1344(-)
MDKSVTGIDREKQDGNSSNVAASNSSGDLSNFSTEGTLAIDIGTARLKLSNRPSLANKSQYKNQTTSSPNSISLSERLISILIS